MEIVELNDLTLAKRIEQLEKRIYQLEQSHIGLHNMVHKIIDNLDNLGRRNIHNE